MFDEIEAFLESVILNSEGEHAFDCMIEDIEDEVDKSIVEGSSSIGGDDNISTIELCLDGGNGEFGTPRKEGDIGCFLDMTRTGKRVMIR